MKLEVVIDISELMGKSKEIDLTKLLEVYQKLDKGETVNLFNNLLTIKKMEEVEKK